MEIVFTLWDMVWCSQCSCILSFLGWSDGSIDWAAPTLNASLPLQVGSRIVPKEVALLLKLDHRYIIQLLDYFEEEDKYVIVMERPEKYIDLFDYITQKEVLSERTARHLFRWAREQTLRIGSMFDNVEWPWSIMYSCRRCPQVLCGCLEPCRVKCFLL